ncbi:unnamed protein product [Trypanosoma congolense IL3000]|uniref:WGS project CAEQ00000000 data, annotated contig 1433 n=1 Tax=Trypanosoma congolense (strain IL3000) TaxID=1068625 RepID=F9W686_TRYCI|nr:unnamed protein product [Trypanosoma congolense IL3000]
MLSLPREAPKVNSLESHFNSAVVKDVELFFADLCKGICLLPFGQWTPIAHKSLCTQWSGACSAFTKFQLAASVVSSLTLFPFIMLRDVSFSALLNMHISTTLLSYWFTFSNFLFQVFQFPCPERCQSISLLYQHPCRGANCRQNGAIQLASFPRKFSNHSFNFLTQVCRNIPSSRYSTQRVGPCLRLCTS